MRRLGRLRAAVRADDGVTLIETLVALSILSIAGVAVMAGLQLTVQTSDIHRKQSTGGAYVRSYAEAIETYLNRSANYVSCATSAAYAPGVVGFTEPAGYTAQQEGSAQPLDGDGSVLSGGGCPDRGVQRLRLSVRSNDGRATERLTIVVRRACGATTSCG